MLSTYVAAYLRVAETIRERIRAGTYRPGDKLPTKRQLAADLGVGPQSVDTAMVVLRTEGWVRGEQGRGVYVADQPPQTPRPISDAE